jgi:hypothetical protein
MPAFVLVKMVLRHPCGVKAAAFGVHDLRGGQAIALGCIRLIEQAGEKAKAQPLMIISVRFVPTHQGVRMVLSMPVIAWHGAYGARRQVAMLGANIVGLIAF